MRSDVIATYVAWLPTEPSEAAAAAEAFAVGQSLGTWTPVPGITERMRADHGATVTALRPVEPGEEVGGESIPVALTDGAAGRLRAWLLSVAFPAVNFGPQFPMLFTTLLGNDASTSLPVRLVDMDLPSEVVTRFPGPRHGIAGWRRLTGVADRPLLLNMIKPCTGYPPEVGVEIVDAVARGGCDLVKDDELLADAPFNRVAERVRVYRSRLEEIAAETGHRARYMPNVTTRPRNLVGLASQAVEAGADALMVSALFSGLDGLQTLAEANLGVPIFAHSAGIETFTGSPRAGFGHALLLGRLARLAGADGVLFATPFAPRPLARGVFESTLERMRGPWLGHEPAMPFVGGGLRPEHVPGIVRLTGGDVVLAVGGAIQGHPAGATEGARVVRRAIDQAWTSVKDETATILAGAAGA